MGLVTVNEVTVDDDVGMVVSGGKSWGGTLVILLQNGVVQHNWYWSDVVMFSHGIIEIL